MTPKFLLCVAYTLKEEGGYGNNPNDPGGETNFGISKCVYPNEDIKNMTQQRAMEIYFRDYWTPMGCENLKPTGLALALFDAGVNCGTGTAKGWLEPEMTVAEYSMKRVRYYERICQKNPRLTTFLLGWIIRAVEIYLWGKTL